VGSGAEWEKEAELERMRAEIAALEKRQEAAEEQVSHAEVTEVTSVSLTVAPAFQRRRMVCVAA
jgi:hypothetical protein